jgi:nucleoside-diphosphate-sugar epimerase
MARKIRRGDSTAGNFDVRVAVSGSSGFIGEHVVASLLSQGHEVLEVGRQQSNTSTTFKELDLNHLENFDFKALGVADVLIHLAWANLQDFRSLTHINEELPKHETFFERAQNNLPRHVIGIGTCLEYGLQSGSLDESLPTAPILAYAQAKHAFHQSLKQSLGQHSVALTWLRLFYVYGNNKRRKTLFTMMADAASKGDTHFSMSKGDQIRDFISVVETADIICHLAKKPHNGMLNVGSGRPISVRQFAEEQISENGWKLTPQFGEKSVPDYEPLAFWANRSLLDKTLSGAS